MDGRNLTPADLDRMRVPVKFRGASWAAATITAGRAEIRAYLRDLPGMVERGMGLMIRGRNGTGKTALAILLLCEIRRLHRSCLFITSEDLRLAALERTVFDDEQTIVERATTVGALLIDDIGKEHQPKDPSFSQKGLENILRTRSNNGLLTLFTTNIVENAKLLEMYRPSTLHLLGEMCVSIVVDGPDHRVEINRAMKGLLAP